MCGWLIDWVGDNPILVHIIAQYRSQDYRALLVLYCSSGDGHVYARLQCTPKLVWRTPGPLCLLLESVWIADVG